MTTVTKKRDTEDGPFDVVVIGAGLAGLTAALVCHSNGLTVKVIEAQDRIGGRIHSLYGKSGDGLINNSHIADLGPTWVWAKYQPVVKNWMQTLALDLMPQYEVGKGMLDRHTDQAAEPWPLPGQDGMTRIKGGPQAIVNALASRLPQDRISTNSPVDTISKENGYLLVNSDACQLQARHVIVATPLAMAAERIQFSPSMPVTMSQVMQQTSTWMAQQAKAVIQYPQAFWREQGLSGRLASQVGPLAEAHDHSAEQGNPAALFGFVGVPPALREQHGDALKHAITAQLVRVFGEAAARPSHIHIEDWATNRWICTDVEKTSGGQHPNVLPDIVRTSSWDGRLHFAVSETSTLSPGLIEGALHAGETCAMQITRPASSSLRI